MSQPGGDNPQIVVDTDWKSQAQAEKERLSQAESKTAPKGGTRAGVGPGGQGPEEALPPADLTALVGMLVSQSLMYLGGMADRKSGGYIFDPEMARYYIDLLGVLEAKTKGNLSDAESKDIASALHELRARYVELSRAVAQQMAESKARAGGAGSLVPGGAEGTGSPPMIRVG